MQVSPSTFAAATEFAPDNLASELLGFDRTQRFINRELSWVAFNERVLEEASNAAHPLLERLKFLSISASNLEEFFMVRVAGLVGQTRAGLQARSQEMLTPQEQLDLVSARANKLLAAQQNIWQGLCEELAAAKINILSAQDLTDAQIEWAEDYFLDKVLPMLTPLAIDPAHPFPFIPNLGLAMALQLRKDGADTTAVILLPQQLPRFIKLPEGGDAISFLPMENLLAQFIGRIFVGYELVGQGAFRLIRDSDIEVEEEAEDLVRLYESALKRRRRGSVIRLKLAEQMPRELQNLVSNALEVDKQNIVQVNGLVGLSQIVEIYDALAAQTNSATQTFSEFAPRTPSSLQSGSDYFAAIAAQDILLHHPYESFEVVVDFIRQAARDPQVVAIKQTLYRTSHDSPIVAALIEAAEAGKSVTALVELKARFDEAANIRLARAMERAGVQVVYGFMRLKTHAKISIIVRKENEVLTTYSHLGTGNYNPLTAKVYTDLSLFTCNKNIAEDVGKVFNFFTGYAEPKALHHLAVSPLSLRSRLVEHIAQEISNAKAGRPAHIWAKLNSLVDGFIIDELYRASCAGVQIDLVVRGICCLRAGVVGLSENIRVKSIIGRFLEHARIVCFANGAEFGEDANAIYISSADWMPRNLDRRVEVLTPILDAQVRERVLKIMKINFADNQQSWYLQADGTYQRASGSDEAITAHNIFMQPQEEQREKN